MTAEITLQDAAQQLGVHYMTVYRYVRTGRLEARKHDGQWWVRPGDLTNLQNPVELAAPRSDARPRRRRWDRYIERLVPRLIDGDEAGAWGVVESTLTAGAAPIEIHVDLIGPCMRDVGDRWEAGTLTVGGEHRASAVAQRLVGRLSPRFARRGRRRGTVVLAGAPGDIHALPVALVADVLRGGGFEVIDFGANTPSRDVALAASENDNVVAVALSASTGGREDELRATIADIRSVTNGMPILLGGPAVADAALATSLGATGWAPDARSAVELVESVRKR